MSDAKGFVMHLITEMEQVYTENASGRPMEYTYGFMDALAVVRQKVEEPTGPDPWKLALGTLLCAAFAGAGKPEEKCGGCPNC